MGAEVSTRGGGGRLHEYESERLGASGRGALDRAVVVVRVVLERAGAVRARVRGGDAAELAQAEGAAVPGGRGGCAAVTWRLRGVHVAATRTCTCHMHMPHAQCIRTCM